MTSPLLTTAEVADRCGVTRQTVHNWVEKGRVTPVLVLKNGHLLFDPADVDRLTEATS